MKKILARNEEARALLPCASRKVKPVKDHGRNTGSSLVDRETSPKGNLSGR